MEPPSNLVPRYFLIPVDFHLLAVRIGRRDEEDDDVLEDGGGVERRVAGDQLISQLHGHLRRGDLARRGCCR